MTAEQTNAGPPADVRLDTVLGASQPVSNPAGARQVGSWTTGFHGVVAHSDLPELAGVLFRDVALGRRSLGAGPLDALTDLPSDPDAARRHGTSDAPTLVQGGRHVGRNNSASSPTTTPTMSATSTIEAPPIATPTTETSPSNGVTSPIASAPVAPSASPRPRPPVVDDGNTERYVARRLEDADWVFLPNRSRTYAVIKRTVDLLGAILLFVVALPVMVAIAIAIKIDSPGPALFRQERVTLGGRHFRFYKFRTMYVDAKDRFPDLYAYQFTDSSFDDAFYKLADDPRNTRFGTWLRRTTLDELPNLLNVLKGDLSLVGPRPELPELVRYYRPEELACFFTKAGLTGLAQVAGRSLLTVRERLTLDLRYISHQTMLLDIRILWRTLLVVVARKGAF